MKKREQGILYLVIPCFNEEEVLDETARELDQAMSAMIGDGLISSESRIVFVDDGSRDRTWEIISRWARSRPLFAAIGLQANAGHQNALYAGLMEVRTCCHMAISMDADLQDDPALLPDMVKRFYEGNDIVYAVRRSRNGEGLFKRASAFVFYRFMAAMGAGIPKDCGDFRLMSRQAMEALSLFGENRPFLRGLIPLLGFPSAQVFFDRRPRRGGKSKYSLKNMVGFAMDGMISFSATPVHMILAAGIFLFLASGTWLLFHMGNEPGTREVIAAIWGATGLLLTGMGVMGQYIVRIWQGQTGRPRYLIKEMIGVGGDKDSI